MGQPCCCLVATNERDERALSAQELLEDDQGQTQVERGLRFLKDPRFVASARERKKPARLMALVMVMTVWLLVYAAVASRMRTALKTQQATFPNHQGQAIQHPTARWVFQYFVGMHRRCTPGAWPLGLNLNDEQQHLLGQPDKAVYS